jgi:electron transfer flavoprotein beta subunit
LGGGVAAKPTAPHPGAAISITQAIPGGGRRQIELGLPAVVTVGPSAPAPLPYSFVAARRGQIVAETAIAVPAPACAVTERPYRRRPRLVRGAPAASTAADRLRQATEVTGGGQLMVAPSPDDAAAAILEFLARLQLAPGTGGSP